MTTGPDPRRCRASAGRLLGKMRRAIRRWELLPPGSRVALGISGGVDSLVMLWLLAEHARSVRPPLELVGLHVRLDARGVTGELPREVVDWAAERGVEIRSVPPRFDAAEEVPESCFRCARIRRRTLLEVADGLGFPRVALGHHADDVVETWLMGLFFGGSPGLLAPSRSYFQGVVTVVRPLYELRAGEIRRMGRLCGLPTVASSCPLDGSTSRETVRRVLGALGPQEQQVRRNLFWQVVRNLEREAGGAEGCATVNRE